MEKHVFDFPGVTGITDFTGVEGVCVTWSDEKIVITISDDNDLYQTLVFEGVGIALTEDFLESKPEAESYVSEKLGA